MPSEKYGEFCQWHPSTFYVSKPDMSALVGHPIDRAAAPLSPPTELDKEQDQESDEAIIFFKCAEQFMMYCKAGRFHDVNTQSKILASTDPKEQKKLGKSTKGFIDEIWNEVKSDVVVARNMAKFGQNSRLKAILLGTGEREPREAASRDRVWGIGYTAKHAMSHCEDWGENRLGRALMEVRARLRGVEGGQPLHLEERDGDGEEGLPDGVTAGSNQQLDECQDGAERGEWVGNCGKGLSQEKLEEREA